MLVYCFSWFFFFSHRYFRARRVNTTLIDTVGFFVTRWSRVRLAPGHAKTMRTTRLRGVRVDVRMRILRVFASRVVPYALYFRDNGAVAARNNHRPKYPRSFVSIGPESVIDNDNKMWSALWTRRFIWLSPECSDDTTRAILVRKTAFRANNQ